MGRRRRAHRSCRTAELTFRGSGEVHTFFDAGLGWLSAALQSIEDRNGNTVQFSYGSGTLVDGTDKPVGITDSRGRTHDINIATDHLSGAELSNGTDVSYTITSGDLVSVTDGEGDTMSFTYGGENNLTRITDGRGNHIDITYVDPPLRRGRHHHPRRERRRSCLELRLRRLVLDQQPLRGRHHRRRSSR